MTLKPKRRAKRRPFVTQDGTTIARPVIVYGEALPIWGEPIALDAQPRPSGQPVTFDGALPPRKA